MENTIQPDENKKLKKLALLAFLYILTSSIIMYFLFQLIKISENDSKEIANKYNEKNGFLNKNVFIPSIKMDGKVIEQEYLRDQAILTVQLKNGKNIKILWSSCVVK